MVWQCSAAAETGCTVNEEQLVEKHLEQTTSSTQWLRKTPVSRVSKFLDRTMLLNADKLFRS